MDRLYLCHVLSNASATSASDSGDNSSGLTVGIGSCMAGEEKEEEKDRITISVIGTSIVIKITSRFEPRFPDPRH